MIRPNVEGTLFRAGPEYIRLSGCAAHPAHSLTTPWVGLQPSDAVWMASKGFTACRLGVFWHDIELSPGVYDESALRYIDEAIKVLAQYGIYTILDMHIWKGGPRWPEGEGVPTFYSDTYPATDAGMTHFYLDFWANTGQAAQARQAYMNLWSTIAQRYTGNPDVAGYEPFNEPNVFPASKIYLPTFAPQIMHMYNNIWGPMIRAIDPTAILFYDAIYYELWEAPPTWNTKPTLPNVAYCRSNYDKAYDYTHDFTKPIEVHRTELTNDIIILHNHFIGNLGVPLVASEIGLDLDLPNAMTWVDDVLRIWDETSGASFGWQWYRYNMVGDSPRDPVTGADRPVAAILEAYAQLPPPPPPVHLLTVESQPVSGIPFSINGTQLATPYSETLQLAQYTITMPSNVQVGTDTYNFTNWQHGPTVPATTIDLIADTALVAIYELQPAPPAKGILDIHASLEGIEIVADIIIVETGQALQTPVQEEVNPGTYTVKAISSGKTLQQTAIVQESQTIRVDFDFTTPTPKIPILPIIAIIGVILSKGK